ncbi:MAG: hypothetical protein ACYTHN_10230 [Planctomycetota bacterium]|jgi:hypothetical protein
MRILFYAVAIAGWFLLSACPSAPRVSETPRKPAPVTPEAQWERIYARGEEGRTLCEEGLDKIRHAVFPEEREEGYQALVLGYRMCMEAVERGDRHLLDLKVREPGKALTANERAIAAWAGAAVSARRNLPLKYVRKLD